jgi:hypothetical protein
MEFPDDTASLERQIERWRDVLRRRQAFHPVEVPDLEDRLREQVASLVDAGLSTDEAFLVAVKRAGELDPASREYARDQSDRLWKNLAASAGSGAPGRVRTDALVAVGLAVAAAVLIKLPELFGVGLDHEGFYLRNLAFFVLPLLAGYFAWKRTLEPRTVWWLAGAFVVAIVFANVYPFVPGSSEAFGHTEALTGLHLPIALWLAVGIAHAGGRWGEVSGRMDFIRFSGELFIYFVLIALGGGVLTAFTALIFGAIGIDVESFFQSWMLPCGATGAVLIASWLVEAKQNVMENMAPVLTRLFTPLFAVLLVAFLAAMLWTGNGIDVERNVLIAFDLLLVVVLGLLLYSISSRDPESPPGLFDVLQVVLVVSTLAADAVAMWAILERIAEFGFTPNRVAALGMNVVLMVNLGGSALLYAGFLRGRSPFSRLERWQTGYLPVYAAWAAIVVIVFPPLFGFI